MCECFNQTPRLTHKIWTLTLLRLNIRSRAFWVVLEAVVMVAEVGTIPYRVCYLIFYQEIINLVFWNRLVAWVHAGVQNIIHEHALHIQHYIFLFYTGWPRKNGTGYFPQYVDAITGIRVWGDFSWEKLCQDQQFWFSSLFSRAHFVRQCRGPKFFLFSIN